MARARRLMRPLKTGYGECVYDIPIGSLVTRVFGWCYDPRCRYNLSGEHLEHYVVPCCNMLYHPYAYPMPPEMGGFSMNMSKHIR